MKSSASVILFQYLMPLVYATLFYFIKIIPSDGSYWSVLIFLAGFYLGNILLWADGAFMYPLYNELHTLPKQLITRSALFLLVYVCLGIFVITSSGNYLGSGVIFGIGLTLLSELYATHNDVTLFHQKFLFQLKRMLSPLEVLRLVQAFAGVVLLLSILFFV